jgi:hypothetical protein
VAHIAPDIHVGAGEYNHVASSDGTDLLSSLMDAAGGALQNAEQLFNNPPVPGFTQSAINCEVCPLHRSHSLASMFNKCA